MSKPVLMVACLWLIASCVRGGDAEPPTPEPAAEPAPTGPPASERLRGVFEHEGEAGGVAFVVGVSFDGQALTRWRNGVPTGADACSVEVESERTVTLRCTDEAGRVSRPSWGVSDDEITDLVTQTVYRRVADAPTPEGSGGA